MKKALLVLLVLVLGSMGWGVCFVYEEKELENDEALFNMYERWLSEHSVSRSDEEKQTRFNTFKQNAVYINNFNKKESSSFTMKLNQFADMSEDEFRSNTINTPPQVVDEDLDEDQHDQIMFLNQTAHFMYDGVKAVLPNKVDWRKKGAVTRVKNQMNCPAGFAAVAAIEGIHYIRTKQLVTLSEQQLIDCDTSNENCEYGCASNAFIYVKRNGLTAEKNYPYKNEYTTYCVTNMIKSPLVWIDGYQNVPKKREDVLMRVVANQPVSAMVDSSSLDFHAYNGGLFDGKCNTVNLNHIVTIVGYGKMKNGKKYWLIKNSWGLNWGERGYMKLRRGVNKCGIALCASYPIKYKHSSSKDEL